MTSDIHVALTAHVIDPHGGSEGFIAWNWAQELCTRVGRVTVVIPPGMADRLSTQLQSNLAVVVVPPTPRWETRIRVPEHYREYVAFLQAADVAIGELGADISHQLVWGTPYWGSAVASARGRTVLGPVGISAPIPPWALRAVPPATLREELTRRALRSWPGRPISATTAIRAADHILVGDRRAAAVCEANSRPWSAMPQDGTHPLGPQDVLGLEHRQDLVWAGRLMPRKAAPLAVRAFAAARTRLPGSARLVLVGDGPDMARLLDLRRELNLGHQLVLLGWLPGAQTRALVRGARALVFTSLRDALGGIVLEAAEAGTPLVTALHSGVDGLRSWVPAAAMWGGEARSLRGMVRVLANAMVAAYCDPPADWQAHSDAALGFACRHSWASRADRMVGIYRGLLDRS